MDIIKYNKYIVKHNTSCLSDIFASINITERQKKYITTHINDISDKFMYILIKNILTVIKKEDRYDAINCYTYIFVNDDYYIVKTIRYNDMAGYGNLIMINICDYYGNQYNEIYIGLKCIYVKIYKIHELLVLSPGMQYFYSSIDELNVIIIKINEMFKQINIKHKTLNKMIDYYKYVEVNKMYNNKIFCDNDDAVNKQLIIKYLY